MAGYPRGPRVRSRALQLRHQNRARSPARRRAAQERGGDEGHPGHVWGPCLGHSGGGAGAQDRTEGTALHLDPTHLPKTAILRPDSRPPQTLLFCL